jgi:hypothetical protein
VKWDHLDVHHSVKLQSSGEFFTWKDLHILTVRVGWVRSVILFQLKVVECQLGEVVGGARDVYNSGILTFLEEW